VLRSSAICPRAHPKLGRHVTSCRRRDLDFIGVFSTGLACVTAFARLRIKRSDVRITQGALFFSVKSHSFLEGHRCCDNGVSGAGCRNGTQQIDESLMTERSLFLTRFHIQHRNHFGKGGVGSCKLVFSS